ncbi:sugar phosphate isomerase/epimerase [Sporomusa sp. KB1]|uniref:sugar phosphate isomerase/epimerase family protein n=1 Tax=Sporomusa sp. KB1 TaxID=943346 RepID=UPI0011ACCC85|nr:sugar phosphate isomerase/epimerase [Sporomusa sp. KB1]TWH45536.1 sugar phosphate isomerase/epimerase [Sporomusa sp. KB1]
MKIKGIAINADASVIDGSLAVLQRELDYYQEQGFSYVELSPHGVGAIYGGRLDRTRMIELKELLARYPFRYTVHGLNPLNLMAADPVNRIGFIASLEFTAAVNAEIMVYHAGRYIPEEDFLLATRHNPTSQERASMWQQECAGLREMGQLADQFGITIAVENARPYTNISDYCYAESLEALAKMVREVNHSQIRVTLDTGHAYLAACHYGYDLLPSVTQLAPYVRHIHLHDNFGRASTSWERKQHELAGMGRGDMHMPIGWGDVPAQEIISRLPNYQGVITVELRPRYREQYRRAMLTTQALVKSSDRCVS